MVLYDNEIKKKKKLTRKRIQESANTKYIYQLS